MWPEKKGLRCDFTANVSDETVYKGVCNGSKAESSSTFSTYAGIPPATDRVKEPRLGRLWATLRRNIDFYHEVFSVSEISAEQQEEISRFEQGYNRPARYGGRGGRGPMRGARGPRPPFGSVLCSFSVSASQGGETRLRKAGFLV